MVQADYPERPWDQILIFVENKLKVRDYFLKKLKSSGGI